MPKELVAIESWLRPVERPGRAEERALALEAREGGDEARRALVIAHLRFVVSLARRYRNRGLPLDDLIGEGNLGLLEAVRLYDPSYGTRFITYAAFWIRRAMLRALAAHRTLVHVPPNRLQQARGAREAERSLAAELGRAPGPDVVRRRAGLSRHQMEGLAGAEGVSLSLAAPLSHDGTVCLMDVLPAGSAVDPHDALGRRDAADRVRCALVRLQDRDREVVMRRYGLGGEPPETLRAIGAGMGMSCEAVRVIEARALRRLRLAVTACARGHRRPGGVFCGLSGRGATPPPVKRFVSAASQGGQGAPAAATRDVPPDA